VVADLELLTLNLKTMSKEKTKVQESTTPTLLIEDVVPMLRRIAECIDEAVENTTDDNEGEWDKICTSVELLCNIAEDNRCFVRN
jgi:hypothetical protein